ncbi:hypothetical protein DYB25_008478 [Aphanomyces astaci]|uniref:Glycosyl hydrolase family 38 C-terminal domain-containing protein n=1 Tax=Aphanomyces astaci TaxID=112090 RepID=A0A397A996_APHAT|nr:hypothetical protein DYB25_008478 [Aphanomyces astaci]
MTIGNHIFWPMGMDMEYQNAVKWFKNMDKLIHYTNQAGQLNVLYSTLGHYTDLKLQDKHTQWTIKTDDFFPYANERFGYCGTEKQLVADDYALRVSEGVESGTARLSQLFPSQSVALCLLANVSVCAPSALRPFTFVVYNHLTSVHTYTVTLPFRAKNAHVRLANGSTVPSAVVPFVSVYGKVPLKHQAPNTLVVETLLPPLGWVAYHVVPGKENPHPPSVHGRVEGENSPPTTPPPSSPSIQAKPMKWETKSSATESTVVSTGNAFVEMTINTATGSLVSLTHKASHTTVHVKSSLMYYQAFAKSDVSYSSGAYVFHPNTSAVHPLPSVTSFECNSHSNDLVASCVFIFGSWGTLQYKLSRHAVSVEVEWTVVRPPTTVPVLRTTSSRRSFRGYRACSSRVIMDEFDEDEQEEDDIDVDMGFFHSLRVLLLRPLFSLIVLGLSAIYFVVTGVQFWSTIYLQRNFNASVVIVNGLFVVVAGTGPIWGVFFGGALIDRAGGYMGLHQRAKALGICVCLGFVAFSLGIVTTFLPNLYLTAASLWLVLFFGGSILPSCTGIFISATPVHLRSLASSVSVMVFNLLGYALAPALTGSFMELIHNNQDDPHSYWYECDEACMYRVGFRCCLAWSVWSLLAMLAAYIVAKRQAAAAAIRTGEPPQHQLQRPVKAAMIMH